MIFEVMKLLWPFLKEFFLGKEGTIGNTVQKREWKKLFMLFLMTFSVIANLFLFPKSIILSEEVLKLQREVRHLKQRLPPPPDPDHPNNQGAQVATSPPEPPEQPSGPASEVVTGPPPPEQPEHSAYRERLNSIMSRAQQLDHER